MDSTFTQVGIGGLLAILIIREVFAFLKNRKSNGASGEQSKEFWQSEIRKITTEVIVTVVVPILSSQVLILVEMKKNQEQNNIQMMRIITLIEERLKRNE